jgi:hypothetical protein
MICAVVSQCAWNCVDGGLENASVGLVTTSGSLVDAIEINPCM